jgi:hypothetical protein
MLTGQTPFRGTSAELMYRHLHAPLAIGELDHVPQPVVVLIEVLLEKDPGRRFQNPAELLKAMATMMAAIDARRSNRSSEHSEEPLCRFACRNSQAASTTCTEEAFRSQITHYRK